MSGAADDRSRSQRTGTMLSVVEVLQVSGFGVLAGLAAWRVVGIVRRAARWQREHARRATLHRTVATVEHCVPITSSGVYELTVSFEVATSYREARRVRQKVATTLPRVVVQRATEERTLPIRFDPAAVLGAVIDFEQMLGAEGASFERAMFAAEGTLVWRAVA